MHNLLLYLLPPTGICGLLIPTILGEYNLALLGLYISIPMIIGPFTYIFARRRQSSGRGGISVRNVSFPLLMIIYTGFYSISVIILLIGEIRPLAYYFLITCMSICVLLGILNFRIDHKRKITFLAMLMALTINILWGVTLKYHYFIGRTDLIGHVDVTESLLSTGYVTEVFGIYQPFPLWHILCASTSNVIGHIYSTPHMLFLINGLIYSGMILLTYLISVKISKNEKLSLIVPLFILFNPDFLYYGMSSIARSVTPFFMLLLVFLLIKPLKRGFFLSMIVLVSLILFHPASMPFILSLFCMIFILQFVFKAKDKLFTLQIIAMMAIFTVSYWVYNADELFEAIVNDIIRESPGGVLAKAAINMPIYELFNYLQYLPLLLFMIIGLLYALSKKQCSKTLTSFCLIGFAMVIFAFPGPSFLINKLAADLNFGRFGLYAFFFISVVGSIGFFFLYNRSSCLLKLFAIIIFSCTCILGISNDFVASDNPMVQRPFYTYYLTEDETAAFIHLAEVSEGYVMSDYVSNRYLRRTEYGFKRHILEVNRGCSAFLRGGNLDLILIRDGELSKRPLKLYSVQGDDYILNPSWENSFDYYYSDLDLWRTLNGYNRIYNSKSVSGFT